MDVDTDPVLIVRWVGGLSDRVGRKRVIVPAMAVVAAGSAALALSGSVWIFVAATLITGVAPGFTARRLPPIWWMSLRRTRVGL